MSHTTSTTGEPSTSKPVSPRDLAGDPFLEARDNFLSLLPAADRRLFSPCASSRDLECALSDALGMARRHDRTGRWIAVIGKLEGSLGPYFKIVDIFVSSNPQYAAIAWGAIRLVLQVASNFSTFFVKLGPLLWELLEAFPQYDEMLKLVESPGKNIEKNRPHDFEECVRPSSSARIRNQVISVYQDLFRILHVTVRVFTKADGRIKKTPSVIRDLMWKPFHLKFGDLIHQMENHKVALFREMVLWSCTKIMEDRERAAAERLRVAEDRRLDKSEREEAAIERLLAQEERQLIAEDRRNNSEAQRHTKASLERLHEKMRKLENDRLTRTALRVRQWLSPPAFVDSYERALKMHQEGTSVWFFQEPKYLSWLEEPATVPASRHKFGSNLLWVYGNPGAGKTVLASSVIDRLKKFDAKRVKQPDEVYYYFFEFQSQTSNIASSAYRAILSQKLWNNRDNADLIYRLAFAIDGKGEGQLGPSESVLVDLLRLCLDEQAILVVDGVDECNDNESFLGSLLSLSQLSPWLRILLFSRINVATLNRSVPSEMRLNVSKLSISLDIYSFCNKQLTILFDQAILPDSGFNSLDAMAERLTKGADGMFLWAKLLINFLRSPFITSRQRLEVINLVNLPEGLEEMYDRIFSLIIQAGKTASGLASKILIWLAFSTVQMSSRQIQQALVADEYMERGSETDSTTEFEDIAIMACAGLVERRTIDDSGIHRPGTMGLHLIHLSLREFIESHSQTRALSELRVPRLIPGLSSAKLQLANCCLRQLLYHTPCQPLSGRLNARISMDELDQRLCFTDYAAVHWMVQLKSSIPLQQSLVSYSETDTNGSGDFDSALSSFADSLSTFLRRPSALSVWLESFYTSKNHRKAAGYSHPPLKIIADWALSGLPTTRQHVGTYPPDLVATIQEFIANLEQTVKIWGDRLESSPEIVWDEMTGIVKSSFFFSPGGTKISFQNPERPTCASSGSSSCVALMSRTSDHGELKGVLSIWTSALTSGSPSLTEIRSSIAADLKELCTGWTIVFEVWRISSTIRRVAKFESPIDPAEMLLPVRRYLELGRSEFIPELAISPDIEAFSFSRRLFVLKQMAPGLHVGGPRVFSQILPFEQADEPNFSWKYNISTPAAPKSHHVLFGPSNHLACHEPYGPDSQRLRIVSYGVTERLEISVIGGLNLRIPRTIRNLLFHPSRAIIAFQASYWNGTYHRAIIWQFKNSDRYILHKLDSPSDISSFHFSSCGLYLIAQREAKRPSVLSIPASFLSDPISQFTGSREHGQEQEVQTELEQDNLLQTILLSSGPMTTKEAPRNLHHIWRVDAGGKATSFSMQMTEGNIELLGSSPNNLERAKLVVLPPWRGIEQTRQSLIHSQTPGNAFRISVDMEPRALSNNKTEVQPLIIDRDHNLVSWSRPLSSLTQNPKGSESAESSLRSGVAEGKRRIDEVDAEQATQWVECVGGWVQGDISQSSGVKDTSSKRRR